VVSSQKEQISAAIEAGKQAYRDEKAKTADGCGVVQKGFSSLLLFDKKQAAPLPRRGGIPD
jgi:hypothetical protein